MINRETAIKLKAAGYPIKGDLSIAGTWHEPRLEELIAACGVEFGFLRQFQDHWQAYALNRKDHSDIFTEADSPAEAVAELFLALRAAK